MNRATLWATAGAGSSTPQGLSIATIGRTSTDPTGAAEISIQVDESSLPDSSIMVQANYEGRTVTRKFALRKTD